MIYTCTCHDKYCVHVLIIIGIIVSEDPVPMPHLNFANISATKKHNFCKSMTR